MRISAIIFSIILGQSIIIISTAPSAISQPFEKMGSGDRAHGRGGYNLGWGTTEADEEDDKYETPSTEAPKKQISNSKEKADEDILKMPTFNPDANDFFDQNVEENQHKENFN